MVTSHFIDESFDINNCQNYILSIQYALDGFSFSIYDKSANKFIVLNVFEINTASVYELRNELEKLITESAILSKQFKAVKAMYIQKELLLTPSLLFNLADQKQLYSYSFEVKKGEELFSTTTANSDISILSCLPELIRVLLLEKFPNCKFFNAADPIVQFVMQYPSPTPKIIVTKYNHLLMVIYFNQNKIEFLNNFYVKNDDDCLYYILNISKQLSLDQKTEVVLLGNIEPKSAMFSSLKKIFTKVYFPSFPSKYAVSYTFLKEPDHYHLPIMELALCE